MLDPPRLEHLASARRGVPVNCERQVGIGYVHEDQRVRGGGTDSRRSGERVGCEDALDRFEVALPAPHLGDERHEPTDELAGLRRENRRLREEREILKKATAWFARENDPVDGSSGSSR